jgi:hypothetical protein
VRVAPTVIIRFAVATALAFIAHLLGCELPAISDRTFGLLLVGTLLVPDVGEVQLLKFALGVDASEDQELDAYVNNITPAEGDTDGTYTAATGGGYAQKTLTKTSWTVGTSGGTTTASYAEQTWTFTGPLTTNLDIYGYKVRSATGNILLWAERAAATFTPTNNGDTYKVTPKLEAA